MCYQHLAIAALAGLVIMYALKALKTEAFAMEPPTYYHSSIQRSNPTVQGVTIQNPTNVFKIPAYNAGMLDKQTMRDMFPYNECQGVNAYQIDKAVVKNTIELGPTLESERLRLANALAGTSFNVPPNELYYQRNTLDNLNQPGLSPKMINPSGIYSCF